MMTVCLAVFMTGSAFCALAPSMTALILARALQGFGGGGPVVVAQTIVGEVVSPRERGRYAGYFAAVWASSALLGPLLGGLVAQFYGWPRSFWLNLPLGPAPPIITHRAPRKL